MKLLVISVGHKLKSFEEEWISLYHKRLKHYVNVEMIRLTPKKKFTDHQFISEIEKKTPAGSQVVLLDDTGKSLDTKELKMWIEKLELQSKSQICFVIGESHGFSEKVLKHFSFHMSLSKLTFSHNLALVVLFEQLYRVYAWKAGSPYHHE